MEIFMILLLIACAAILAMAYSKFRYWHEKGVETLGTHIFLGNWLQMKSMHHGELLQELYTKFRGQVPMAGFYVYTKPMAVAVDMSLVQSVLIKDFNYFIDRMSCNNSKDILSQHLFHLEGVKWRPLRNKFSPTFTSAKMRYMFPMMKKLSRDLEITCGEELDTQNDLNVSELCACFTANVISNCILGIDSENLRDDKLNMRQILTLAVVGKPVNIKWKLFKHTYPQFAKYIGYKRYPQAVEDFFLLVIKQSIMDREASGIKRGDFLDICIDLKNVQNFSYNEILPQLFAFLTGGFETSSVATSFALYLLAKHQHIQERLRAEIQDVLKEFNHDITTEAISKMPYLDQVIHETLRLYPIFAYLERKSVADYKIPNTNIVLEKGTTICIPVRSIHYDPLFYEEPEEFRPERFHPIEVLKRHPQSFLGFGAGPRNCIGSRFGKMQVRLGLVSLLRKYKFSICHKTVESINFSKYVNFYKATDDIWLKVEKV